MSVLATSAPGTSKPAWRQVSGRDEHHPAWRERFEVPAAPPVSDSPVEHMKHALKTKRGRAAYALRKQTVEPVFGIIKSGMNFHQLLLRGLAHVSHEWTLVCLAWNFKRTAMLRLKSVQREPETAGNPFVSAKVTTDAPVSHAVDAICLLGARRGAVLTSSPTEC